MRPFTALALGLTLAPWSSLAQEPAVRLPSISLPPALERVLRDYETAWRAGDAAALAALFTEDGFVLSNGRPPVRGRDAIRAAYQNAGGDLRLRALAVAVEDTIGYLVGAYSWGTDAEGPDTGKFLLRSGDHRQAGG